MIRSIDFLMDRCCGALLAAIIAFSAMPWSHHISWIIGAVAAVCGFLFAGFCGRQALTWFRENFSAWWW